MRYLYIICEYLLSGYAAANTSPLIARVFAEPEHLPISELGGA